jgi:hypothetical protein
MNKLLTVLSQDIDEPGCSFGYNERDTDKSQQNGKISLILTAYSHALSAAVVPQLADPRFDAM